MVAKIQITSIDWWKNQIFKEKAFFQNRREINWRSILKCAIVALGIGIVGILLIPAPKDDLGKFHEKSDVVNDLSSFSGGNDPTQEAIRQMSLSGARHSRSQSLDYLYQSGGSSGSDSNDDRNSSMILARGGLDSKTQLPPGSRLSVRLFEKAIVANQGMPVIGFVTKDFIHEDTLAIPAGSKVFGEVSFEDNGDRAKVDWRSIQFPDGRERQLSAIGVSDDGQVGVIGNVKSQAIKNTVGQTLTRFIGAYAEGSMQRGALGSNQGGEDNGWKNAIAGTAKDQAEAFANDLKKEKRWIEVSNSTEFFAVLTANFAFRDPGAMNGR
jgi:hypothetical protein